ncbi:MAG TPA: hypothetical protein VFB16_12620 [Bauldia sp.]|nr:hypothetical protein [Bauldia sp.]
MTRSRWPAIVALVASLAVFTSIEAQARNPYDGIWSIFITGTPGACFFGYSLSVRVKNGLVVWRGQTFSRAAIGIGSSGAVAIRLSDGKHTVTGSGSISKRLGNGHWTAPSFRCTGRWSAYRR